MDFMASLAGNYLLLDEVPPWGELAGLCDERWYIGTPVAAAMRRVLKRHVATGKPADVAARRVQTRTAQ